MMTPQIAALRIGRGIVASENGIDTVIARTGELIATMTSARVETGSPAATGHRAIARQTDGRSVQAAAGHIGPADA